jgi:hypothetical protein
MANPKGNPQNLKPFKKGQSGNPLGPNALPKELLAAKKMNRIECETIFARLINLPKDKISEVLKDPKASMLEITIATILFKAAQNGDHQRLNFILDRTVGKVVERLQLEGKLTLEQALSDSRKEE